VLLSRKRKLCQLYYVTATDGTLVREGQPFRDNERAFLDENDLEK